MRSPFGTRCRHLHDPRVAAPAGSCHAVAWMQHCEAHVKRLDTDVNVAHLHHQRLGHIHHGTPFGKAVPAECFLSPPEDEGGASSEKLLLRGAWEKFYACVCDGSPAAAAASFSSKESSSAIVDAAASFAGAPAVAVTERHRLEIALAMRGRADADRCRYRPTHVVLGEGCAVLSERAFRLLPNGGGAAEVPLMGALAVHFHQQARLDGHRSLDHQSGPPVIIVREIAFGSDSDPSVRPVSLYFDVPSREVLFCSPAEMDRFRKEKKRRKERETRSRREHERRHGVRAAPQAKSRPSSPFSEDDPSPFDEAVSALCPAPPLPLLRPRDREAFDLVTAVLRHRLDALRSRALVVGSPPRVAAERALRAQELALEGRFRGLRGHWTGCAFPAGEGTPGDRRGARRAATTAEETVPAVDRRYEAPAPGATPAAERGRRLWESFVSTVSGSGRPNQGSRLEVFRRLSEAEPPQLGGSRAKPSMPSPHERIARCVDDGAPLPRSTKCWADLLLHPLPGMRNDWHAVLRHYRQRLHGDAVGAMAPVLGH